MIWPDRPIAIEPVGPKAAATVAALHAASFAAPWSPTECEALLADRRVLGLLAVERGWFRLRPVGFVLARTAGDEAEILSIGVAPQARRRGVGHRLMHDVIARLPAYGAAALFLEVDEGNEPALTLYARLGFRRVGRREAYYRAPGAAPAAALVLRLDLA